MQLTTRLLSYTQLQTAVISWPAFVVMFILLSIWHIRQKIK